MTMELTINGTVFKFKFGFGFKREIDDLFKRPIEGFKGKEEKVGMQYVIAYLVDRDPDYLLTVLDVANKNQTPRLTKQQIEEYLEDENTDIDAVFDLVLDFLSRANISKKVTLALIEAADRQKKLQEMEQEKEMEAIKK